MGTTRVPLLLLLLLLKGKDEGVAAHLRLVVDLIVSAACILARKTLLMADGLLQLASSPTMTGLEAHAASLCNAHAAAMAALQALERALPPPPPAPSPHLSTVEFDGQMQPYFVHGTLKASPLLFATAQLEHAFLNVHRDGPHADDDFSSTRHEIEARRESALAQCDGVYQLLMNAGTARRIAPVMAQRVVPERSEAAVHVGERGVSSE